MPKQNTIVLKFCNKDYAVKKVNRLGGSYTNLKEYGNPEFNSNFHNQPHFSRHNIQQGA